MDEQDILLDEAIKYLQLNRFKRQFKNIMTKDDIQYRFFVQDVNNYPFEDYSDKELAKKDFQLTWNSQNQGTEYAGRIMALAKEGNELAKKLDREIEIGFDKFIDCGLYDWYEPMDIFLGYYKNKQIVEPFVNRQLTKIKYNNLLKKETILTPIYENEGLFLSKIKRRD